MLNSWRTYFSVDIVTLATLYIVGRHLEAQLLGLVRQTAFREKKLPEANAPRCAASGNLLQHTRQRPCNHRKAVFFCAMERDRWVRWILMGRVHRRRGNFHWLKRRIALWKEQLRGAELVQ